MKKGLLVTTLVAASSLLLASCEKTIGFEDAKKHVSENFTTTEKVMFDTETVIKVSEVDGFFKAVFAAGEKTEKASGLMGVITPEALNLFGGDATYKVDGKKLSAEKNYDVKTYLTEMGVEVNALETYSGNVYGKVSTDEQGYVVSEYYKVDNLYFKTNSVLGLAVEGKLSMEQTVTRTARPAN